MGGLGLDLLGLVWLYLATSEFPALAFPGCRVVGYFSMERQL